MHFNLFVPEVHIHLPFSKPSDYDDCVGDKAGNYKNCSVLCMTVVHNDMHPRKKIVQFLKIIVGLGLGLVFVRSFRFSILCVF